MAPSNMNNIPQAVLTKIDETDDYGKGVWSIIN